MGLEFIGPLKDTLFCSMQTAVKISDERSRVHSPVLFEQDKLVIKRQGRRDWLHYFDSIAYL